MFLLKNCNDPELSEDNRHARLSHSKRSFSDVMFTDEKIYTVATPKNPQND